MTTEREWLEGGSEADWLAGATELEDASAPEHMVDCSYPDRHADEHRPHPATGRLVCGVCHPPMGGQGG